MAPRTRQARHLNHTLSGLKNTSLGDSMHASIVDQMGVEAVEAQCYVTVGMFTRRGFRFVKQRH